jgi:hypothetical protein
MFTDCYTQAAPSMIIQYHTERERLAECGHRARKKAALVEASSASSTRSQCVMPTM